MLAVRTILHPTDFSERAALAFRLACSLARDHGARLLVLHVAPPAPALYIGVTPPEPDRSREERCNRLRTLQPHDPLVRVERLLTAGQPGAAIVQTAKASGCDLIVMGTHGRTGLSRALMGSVAEEVVRKATCPVLTVKFPFPAQPTPGATDGAPATTQAMG
jgi:nucleotide-binding universal stress UspA family protein